MSPRKIIQIAAATTIDGEAGVIESNTECYALDDCGDVWNYCRTTRGWEWIKLPPLPEDDK